MQPKALLYRKINVLSLIALHLRKEKGVAQTFVYINVIYHAIKSTSLKSKAFNLCKTCGVYVDVAMQAQPS